MKAKIGITAQYDNYQGIVKISPFYAQAIENSGGIPFILPYSRDAGVIEEMANDLDGILFTGGTNIDPLKYGENVSNLCGSIEYERDLFELELCKRSLEKDRSILGICRGCQLITVANGGKLIQHIESHDQTQDKHISSHPVEVLPDTLLYNIIKAEKTDVNSFHHQAVKNLGGLKIAARTLDGSIEAVYMDGKKFCLGIQWHPERMYSTNIHAKAIFDSFIASCS